MANKIREKLEKTFERALEKTLTTAKDATTTAKSIAQATAKQSLDQVLLGLQHKGVDVTQPARQSKDLVYAVGKKVLERAEVIRSQVAANPKAPSWIKDLNLNDLIPKKEDASELEPPEAGAAEVGATEADTALATAAAAGDGEAEESLEDSLEEKAAGVIAEGAKVTQATTAKVEKTAAKTSVRSPIEEAVEKTEAGINEAKAKAKKSKSQETSH